MKRGARILVVDDVESLRFIMTGFLDNAGYRTTSVADGNAALAELDRERYDLILSDMLMPEMDGVTLLHHVRLRDARIPFVLVTGHGSIDNAVAVMKEGADDYLLKPINWDELLVVVERLLENAQLRISYDRMLDNEREKYSFQNMSSRSLKMGKALSAAQQVATSPSTTIAIYGESGVGKEVLTRAIHIASGKTMASLVAVNCAAIPEALLESELFGHVKGAFTGADHEREGKCSRANGGTLFLDEIGDMPLSLQPKLLRLLEERSYEKVGSDQPVPTNFRIIVATHRDLRQCCTEGTFRWDLFYRLNIFPITVPPLRDRREDILQLSEFFLNNFQRHQGKVLPGLSEAALELMMAYDWPGNVRELRNVLEYATIVTSSDLIRPEHLRLPQADSCLEEEVNDLLALRFTFSPEEISLESFTKKLAAWALVKCGNNKSSAARLLKVSRKQLFY